MRVRRLVFAVMLLLIPVLLLALVQLPSGQEGWLLRVHVDGATFSAPSGFAALDGGVVCVSGLYGQSLLLACVDEQGDGEAVLRYWPGVQASRVGSAAGSGESLYVVVEGGEYPSIFFVDVGGE
ncbi:hypothetical protein [Pyrodictium abyssi]|uniref:Uncharacterized protein n=1 Tax=Pyrodictium abyssi TaxID=54256 RepID=A0ABN6ZPR3_9CREN|nr:hypothetical protein PABY_17940 [Pyrodictium abyssi]